MTSASEDQRSGNSPTWFTPTRRSPRWLIIFVFAAGLGVAIPISAFSLVDGSADMALTASSLFMLAGFAAFNFGLWTTRICVVLLWAGLGLGLMAGGHDLDIAWLIFGVAAIAGAGLLCRGIVSVRDAAVTDPLTGLQNRTGLWEECERAIAICRRLNQPLTLVHIDLDGFKEVNDREGHAEGDRILRLCAERWAGVIRSGDTLARIGGDEFLLILPGSDSEAARRLMGRLREVSPIEWCFGAAEMRLAESIQDCMDRADIELYASKRDKGLHVRPQMS
ncbi:MAG TPA: GGDEF domain-containing protein [Solirubrobacterales bacterium]|nr:GGDEF domain-containing protein [Solirubrobacterales bacterium]